MRTQTIFATWTIAPTFRTKVKKAISFDRSKIKVKSFFCGPNKLGENSMINYLKSNLGIKVNGVTTLKTDFISASKTTLYNGHHLSLRVNNEIVELLIKDGSKQGVLKAWEISKLTGLLFAKNTSCDFINKENVVKLINDGDMVVKFNVSTSKDHGTIWKIV